jgi:hypothetical protein
MRLVLPVGTLVFALQPETFFQTYPLFWAEFIKLICKLMGSFDAARSCGSNPGRRFGNGWLVVDMMHLK